jgi:uncharacterized protein
MLPAPSSVQLVPDPNVLVSAVVTPGGVCAELVRSLDASPLIVITSPLLLAEVERVLARPRFAELPAGLRRRYLDYLRRLSTVEDDPPAGGPPLVPADPGDGYLVRLTLAGERRLLVSGDQHLLACADRYPIVAPRDVLDRLP